MINFFNFSAIVSLLSCLTLGVLYAWLLYGKLSHLSPKIRLTLSALRVVAVTLISWMLFAPLFKTIAYTAEKPIIILAHDNSLSVAQIKAPEFNQNLYRQNMRDLQSRLSAKYDVRTYNFADSVKSGLDFSGKGKLSNGTVLIDQVKDEVLNRNLGAVIIASDGIFNRGGNPLYSLKQLNAPVYTIAMGDTIPKRDLLISGINYNNLVYLDNEFTLEVQVQGYQSKGEVALLTVSENGVKIKEERVDVNSNSFLKNVPIKLKAAKVGMQKYSIAVSALKNEITTRNNTQTIFVEVIDAKQKIILVASAPHPDIATLKQAIEQNKHYEVTVVMPDEIDEIKLSSFNLAIIYQYAGLASSNFSSQLRASSLPIWFILGSQTDINNFNSLQNSVKLNRTNGAMQEIFPLADANFTMFTVEPNAIGQLSNYPPLYSPFGNLSVNGSYSALLKQKIGRVNTQSPLWFFMNASCRKMSFLLGEGLWKWRLEEAKDEERMPLVNELISKTIQYLSVKDDKRKFKVYANKPTFDENEPIVLNATLYNDAYEPVTSPEVTVQIKSDKGKLFNYNFSRSGSNYRLNAGLLPEGNYSYLASASLGSNKYTASGLFYVNGLITEYQQTTANHQLLFTMAHQNGGKMVMPTEILDIIKALEQNDQVKTISYEDRKYEELINFKWLFAFILLLLSLEWFMRKRNGEI
ncbi:MAG: hypothetical protein ACQUHE_01650 [Bacteroidia bacterium]